MSPTKSLISNSPEAVWHEQNRRQTVAQRIIPSAHVALTESVHGVSIRLKNPNLLGGSSSSGGVTQYRLKDASYADFYICRELTANGDWDPDIGALDPNRFTEGDTDVYIAKPYLLRRSEFDGLTITVATEYLNGINIAVADRFYKFTYYSANFRKVEQLASVGGAVQATEYQTVLSRHVVDDDIIYAVENSDLQMQAFEEDITLLALPDGRAWARAVSPFA